MTTPRLLEQRSETPADTGIASSHLPAARPGSLLRAAGTPSDPIERAVAEVQAKAERERLLVYLRAELEEGFQRMLLEADPHGDLLARYRFERWLAG